MGTYRNNAESMLTGTVDTTKFRAFLLGFKNTLLNSGWAQTSDTGQMDETTVDWPAAQTSTIGSQLFYLDDTMHATYPIIMKLSFGRSANSKVTMLMTFGYTTDGASTFTGWSTQAFTLSSGGSNDSTSAATGIAMGSYGEGYAWVTFGRSQWGLALDSLFIHVVREFDENGELVTTNGNWALVFQGVGNTRPYCYSVNREMALYFYDTNPTLAIPFSTTQSGTADETELWKWPMKFPQVRPLATLYTYMAGDIQTDSPFKASVSGVERTYLPSGQAKASYQYSASHMFALVWE